MIIEPKYNVGQTFYAPRCYKVTEHEIGPEITSGKVITAIINRRTFYEARVKKKTISGIDTSVDINGEVTIGYECDYDGASHPESYFSDMHFNVEAARMIANEHEKNGTEYYGVKLS